MLKLYFICGLICAVVFEVYILISTGRLKEKNETWGTHLQYLISIAAFGWLGFIFILVGLISLFFEYSDKTTKMMISPSGLLYTIIFIAFSALVTECTAPIEGANCQDGSYSDATGQGACSWHGGVSSWDKDYWWEDD